MQLRNTRIALLVDNPLRDLKSISLLATELSVRGAIVYLVPQNMAKYELSSLAPDFVVFNYLRKINEKLVEALLDAGIHIAVLDTEGGVMPSIEHFTALLPDDSALRQRIDAVYVWGNKLGKALYERKFYTAEQISITGSPRFDFYADPWKKIDFENSSWNDEGRPIILMTGNFSICNPAMTTPEKEVDVWEKAGHKREQILEWQELNRQTMIGMIDIANALAQRFPQYHIVYRPHPFENLSVYDNAFKNHENLHVKANGSVDEWIRRASIVIQRSSTTGIEAAIAGVPSLIPEWLPVAFPIATIEDISIKCSSQAELFEVIEGLVSGQRTVPDYVRQNVATITEDWFFAIDGLSYRRIADDIVRRVATSLSQISLLKCKDLHYYLDPHTRFSARAQWRLKKILGVPVRHSLRYLYLKAEPLKLDTSVKAFSSDQVSGYIEKISKVFNTETPQAFSLCVRPCDPSDYRFNYNDGRSIVIYQQHYGMA